MMAMSPECPFIQWQVNSNGILILEPNSHHWLVVWELGSHQAQFLALCAPAMEVSVSGRWGELQNAPGSAPVLLLG